MILLNLLIIDIACTFAVILFVYAITVFVWRGESGSFRPRKWVDSPLYYNRWRFFWNYLFISCMQKKIIIHSFWSTLNIYLLVVHTKKNNNSFILVYFCQRSQAKLFLQNLQKNQNNGKKFFFCTNAKVHEMTKMLYKCANNLFFNELRIKC